MRLPTISGTRAVFFDGRDVEGGWFPNNDTLYSATWFNVGEEPLILSHPEMGERYFTFEISAFTSDNFAYVGQRTTGSSAGHFAIVGPGWSGDLPEGVVALPTCPTAWGLIAARTLVNGEEDLPAVHALQAQYKLTPLSLWGQEDAIVPENRDVYQPGEPAQDPLAPWKTLNAMLAENPPPEHHKLLLDQCARIGIGAGLDVEAQPAEVKRSLMRAAVIGVPLLRNQFLGGDWATIVNGWRYPPLTEGRSGDDFLQRAADQSLAGIVANDPDEAVYLVNFTDATGERFSPKNSYMLHFAAGELPPVDAFWSLIPYLGGEMNLVPNPADKYSIGDRTPGLVHDADGGLTLYLQPESPGEQREANWLPTSGEKDWFLILRMYRPHQEVISATWKCPGVTRVN